METLTLQKNHSKLNVYFNRESRESYFEMLEIAQKNLSIVDKNRRLQKALDRNK